MLSKKENGGILAVAIIVVIVLWKLSMFIEFDLTTGSQDFLNFTDLELSDEEADLLDRDFIPGIEYVTNLSGLWAIRFFLIAFLMTPISLFVGRCFSLYIRQSIGIATGILSAIHAMVFILSEGFFSIFMRVELISGLFAFLIIFSLTLTSNKRAMKFLKQKWKTLHRWVYAAVLLVLLHLVLLDQSWLIYVVLFGLGFILRLKMVKQLIK